jgi:hypothetical protein
MQGKIAEVFEERRVYGGVRKKAKFPEAGWHKLEGV